MIRTEPSFLIGPWNHCLLIIAFLLLSLKLMYYLIVFDPIIRIVQETFYLALSKDADGVRV